MPGMTALDDTVEALDARARTLQRQIGRPVVVAVDGGSGAGKSSLAQRWVERAGPGGRSLTVVPLDDFFAAHVPEAVWPTLALPERLRRVFDWSRVRDEALRPMRAGRSGRWHAFDFIAGPRPDGTYGQRENATEVPAADVVVLEGAYAASPLLASMVDLSVLVRVDTAERHRRLALRDDPAFTAKWHAMWDGLEAYYFGEVMPATAFDVVVTNDTDAGLRHASPDG